MTHGQQQPADPAEKTIAIYPVIEEILLSERPLGDKRRVACAATRPTCIGVSLRRHLRRLGPASDQERG